MKTLTLHVTEAGPFLIATAVAADNGDSDGGSASSVVPMFGKDALRYTLKYLEELSEAVITDDVTVTKMLQDGVPFEEIKARAAGTDHEHVWASSLSNMRIIPKGITLARDYCIRCGRARDELEPAVKA